MEKIIENAWSNRSLVEKPETKEAVHPSTLRAFVKEQIESGNNEFDLEIQKKFSVYQGKRTKINR